MRSQGLIPGRRDLLDWVVESRTVIVALAATLLVSSLLTVFFVVAGLDTNREVLDELRTGQESSSDRTEEALQRLFEEMRRQHNQQLLIARDDDTRTIYIVIRERDHDHEPTPAPTRTIEPAPSPTPTLTPSPKPSGCLPVLCE